MKNFINDYMELCKMSVAFSKRHWLPLLVIYAVLYLGNVLVFNWQMKHFENKVNRAKENVCKEAKEWSIGHA